VLEDLLSGVPLFEKLSRRDLGRLVKAGHHVEYPADQLLTSDDEGGISFFVIVEGEARVDVKDKEVRRLGPGDYFGEMALIDRSRRSATVTAVTALTRQARRLPAGSPAPTGTCGFRRAWPCGGCGLTMR
jgi:CRP/FNR family transcriptional regulator, cyclic AMP receptor protein